MNKLVTDWFVRLVAQSVLIMASCVVALACVAFDVIVVGYYRGAVDAIRWPMAYTFVQGVGSFYKNDWSTLFTTVAGVFPVVVASVCYRLVAGETPKVSEDLNPVGRAFFGLSVLTVGLLLLAIGMLTTLKASVLELLGETAAKADNFNAIRELANATLSAYAIDIVQFVGLRSK